MNGVVNEWRTISVTSGQWNRAHSSFIYNGRAVEIAIAPESTRWVCQSKPLLRVLTRGAWLDIPVPPLQEVLGEYVGTYGGPEREEARREQLEAGLDWLTGYIINWIESVDENL